MMMHQSQRIRLLRPLGGSANFSAGRHWRRRLSLYTSALGRLLWLTMLVAHGPALLGAWRSFLSEALNPQHLGGCLALTLAMLFFALKLAGVAFLRVKCGWRGWVAFGLIVGLLHVDCMRPDREHPAPVQWVAVVSMSILIAGPERWSRAIRGALAALNSIPSGIFPAAHSSNTVWFDFFRPHCWLLRFHSAVPRAPPAR